MNVRSHASFLTAVAVIYIFFYTAFFTFQKLLLSSLLCSQTVCLTDTPVAAASVSPRQQYVLKMAVNTLLFFSGKAEHLYSDSKLSSIFYKLLANNNNKK